MLKNMRLSGKLLLVFLIVALLSGVAGVVGVVLINQSHSDHLSVLEEYGFTQGDLGKLGQTFQAQRVITLYLITAPDEEARNSFQSELQKIDTTMSDTMNKIEPSFVSSEDRAVFEELEKGMEAYHTNRSSVIEATKSGKVDDNIALFKKICMPVSNNVRDIINKIVEQKTTGGFERAEQLKVQANNYIFLMLGMIGGSLIIAMILAKLLSNSICNPIKEIEGSAIKMASGDFDVTISHHSGNEIGHLAENMRKMVKNTTEIVGDTTHVLSQVAKGNFDITTSAKYIGVYSEIENSINKITKDLSTTLSMVKVSADQVANGAGQVSLGSQSLSQSTVSQAASLQELAESIKEMTEHIQKNAKNTESTYEVANAASQNVTESNLQMEHMMSAMDEINESSAQIRNITKTIEDIAFQTNILALNAAVEAARAGASGKGFAVVADEVRSLANKSSEAASKTTMLIESSVRSIEKGASVAHSTLDSLSLVVKESEEIKILVENISKETSEQADTISQINNSVDSISNVLQTTSATSQESAATAEELSSQAFLLKELISKFNLSLK